MASPLRRGVTLAILFACAVAWADPAGEEPPNPRYLLQDTRGRAVGNEDFTGRFQLITFGYTSCADTCPTTLARMALIRRSLGARATRLQLVFVTLDPQRDTPANLGRYVAYFGSGIVALRGTPEQIEVAARHFHVRYEASAPRANGFYTIDHSAALYLLDAEGSYVARFAPDAPVGQTVARIGDYMAAAAH